MHFLKSCHHHHHHHPRFQNRSLLELLRGEGGTEGSAPCGLSPPGCPAPSAVPMASASPCRGMMPRPSMEAASSLGSLIPQEDQGSPVLGDDSKRCVCGWGGEGWHRARFQRNLDKPHSRVGPKRVTVPQWPNEIVGRGWVVRDLQQSLCGQWGCN